MTTFRLRNDLERVHLGSFAMPLGIEPVETEAPTVGYTVTYNPGEDDDPDTYAFHVVVSHEGLAELLRFAFSLLPETVAAIVEIDSFDAYRSVDVLIGREGQPISKSDFLETWLQYEPVFLEDGAIGVGANGDEPFVEVFLDQWKGVSIHVPLQLRERVDRGLAELGLSEVPVTWPSEAQDRTYDATIRPILDTSSGDLGTLDDLLFELRQSWRLELNIEPDTNIDDGGRSLGLTLWHVSAYLVKAEGADSDDVALLSVWLSARSWTEMELLVGGVLDDYPGWALYEWYGVTRVAYDDRPEELDHLPPRRTQSEIHMVALHEEAPTERADESDESP